MCIRSPYSESNDVNRQFLEMSVASAAFDIDEDQRDIEHILHRVGLVNSYPPLVWNVMTVVFQLIVTTRLGKSDQIQLQHSLLVCQFMIGSTTSLSSIQMSIWTSFCRDSPFIRGRFSCTRHNARPTPPTRFFSFLFFSSLLSLTDRLFNQ